jgi:hypothetical protein
VATARSSRTLPKPLRLGGSTGGPPRSCHRKKTAGSEEAASKDQRIETVPLAVLKAPCLVAFVVNS